MGAQKKGQVASGERRSAGPPATGAPPVLLIQFSHGFPQSSDKLIYPINPSSNGVSVPFGRGNLALKQKLKSTPLTPNNITPCTRTLHMRCQ